MAGQPGRLLLLLPMQAVQLELQSYGLHAMMMIHAIHPCMPALYVADVASDAIGELYSSHTYVVEPGYVPDYENNRL